jgi:Holliday junction resolvase-like predicted endonuclease
MGRKKDETMTLKIKSISIGERDKLEPMLVANPELIEDGLRVLTHQQQTDTGPLDILGVDAEGTLVVIELKNEAAEGHLDQGLRYYDWGRQNIAWIARAFKDYRVNDKALPRLFLIAPSFTDTIRKIAKYVALGVELKLYEYQALENEKGEMGLICRELDFGEPPEPPRIMSLEDKAKKFEDPKVKRLWEQVLADLPTQEIEVKPVGGHTVTLWYKGKRFMWMRVRRKWFSVNTLSSAGGWSGLVNIKTRKDWDKVMAGQVKKFLAHIDSTVQE